MKQEVPKNVSEITRIEEMLWEIDRLVRRYGSDRIKLFLKNRIAKHQFSESQLLEDLKIQLNWVSFNEG